MVSLSFTLVECIENHAGASFVSTRSLIPVPWVSDIIVLKGNGRCGQVWGRLLGRHLGIWPLKPGMKSNARLQYPCLVFCSGNATHEIGNEHTISFFNHELFKSETRSAQSPCTLRQKQQQTKKNAGSKFTYFWVRLIENWLQSSWILTRILHAPIWQRFESFFDEGSESHLTHN